MRSCLSVFDHTCYYDTDHVIIRDAYSISFEDTAKFCIALKNALPYSYRRSTRSWIRELAVQNYFRSLDDIRTHTIDVDLRENLSFVKRAWYAVVYAMIYVCRKIEESYYEDWEIFHGRPH